MNPGLNALTKELKNRAQIYIQIYRELSKELGKEKATSLLKAALYARGREKGLQLAATLGEPNLHKLALNFMEGQGDLDAFGHEIAEEHSDYVVLRLNHCPLVDGWEDVHLSDDEKKLLCDIAYQVDFGKFEAAGYKLSFNCRIADSCKSCDLRVTL